MAKILGMTEGQVRYAVAKGRILKGAGVDPWGRPFWTEEEVEGAVSGLALHASVGLQTELGYPDAPM